MVSGEVDMKDLTDQIINGFKVTGLHHKQGNKIFWSVICTCGKERNPMREDSILKHTGTCTCKPKKGNVVNGYTYTGENYSTGKRSYYEVVCSCGHSSFKRLDTIAKLQQGLKCPYCRNDYEIDGDKVTMDISSEKHPNTFIKFDLIDLEKVLKYRWYPVGGGTRTKVLYVQCDKEGCKELLHRYILDLDDSKQITDHQDGNGLNNCRNNLRVTDSRGNNTNLPRPHNNTSGVVGISHTSNGKWRAYITSNNRQVGLGTYDNFEEAVKARKDAEVLYGFHENHGRESTEAKGEQK